MIRKIKKTLGGIRHLLFAKREKFENSVINGKNIKAIKGCIRVDNDMDDVWFNKLSQNSEKIFDIGCNVGYTSLVALSNDNIKKMLMVDPNPEALAIANKNVIYNNYVHKTCSFLGFVSDQNDAELEFFTLGYGAAGSMYKSHAETAAAIGSSYKVQTTTIDFLADYFQWSPDFMKVDVEGAEFFVLNGAKKTVTNNPMKILVEMHSSQELSMFDNATKVLNWCKEVGYNAWYIRDSELLSSAETIEKRGKCHLLLLPLNTPYPEYLANSKEREKL